MENLKEEKIIMYDSNEAAQYKTVSGWVSSDGRFFGKDEHMARFAGSTHSKCECGNVKKRSYTKCESCIAKMVKERYNALEFRTWDGASPLCLYNDDKYFFDESEVSDYLEENDLAPEDLMLVMCKPVYAKQIQTDYWEDEMPEDYDLPTELQKKVDEINSFIQTLAPLSYIESKLRTKYEPIKQLSQ